MARIPTNPSVPEPPATPDDASAEQSGAGIGSDPIAVAAAAMGFDPATLDDNTRAFIEAMEGGQLDSLPPGGDPDNPLIPAPADDDDGATPSVDAEGVGVGLDSDASGADGSGDAGAPAVATPAVDLPATVPTHTQGETVNIGGTDYPVAMVQQVLAQQQVLTQDEINTLALMRQGLVTPTMVDPQTGVPIVGPTGQPAPQQPEEWLDPQAQAAFDRLNAQQQQIVLNQRTLNEAQLQRERIGIATGLQAGVDHFKAQRGLDDAQAEALLTSVNELGLLNVYGKMYEGDPRSAIAASLEAVYWGTPAYRDAEFQRFHAEQLAANKPIEDKKAAGGAIATSPGSVPRTAPSAPANRQQADAGMVAMIEQAMNGG
jgi:hypothetical protein